MKELGLNSFRTGIQWSRLIKDYDTCEVDPDAVRFYNEYIDALLEAGIEPFLTLFHFDMPMELQERGGWESKEVVELYTKYAGVCFDLFGDRVKTWFTMNEPVVPVEGGYLYQFHYPLVVDFKRAVQVAYHSALATAKAIKVYKEKNLDGEIGLVLNLTPSYARSESEEDQKAAHLADLFFNRSFLDPAVHGTYPEDLVEFIRENDLTPDTTEEEMEIIKNNTCDLLGVNYYCPRRIQAKESELPSVHMPDTYFDNYDMPGKRMNIYRGWEIYPKALYDIAINLRDNYNNIKWFVSENGMGVENEERFKDENGMIHDDYRIEFISEHMEELHKGIEEGSNCVGYHLWTFVDNWSWKNAYKNRYGYISYDLETRKRTMKKSAYWIKDVVKNNGF
jgi:6-phospho-beta-glucosidase